jgi:DNA-binding HxlR family transcriptional regulator
MSLSSIEKERIYHLFASSCGQEKCCPVKDIMANYGDKWSTYVLLLLGQHNTLRFSELRKNIDGISQRMLTVTLRSLEEDGLVERKLYAEIPHRVEYCLTLLGESLLTQLLQLADWAQQNMREIITSRKRYRQKSLN